MSALLFPPTPSDGDTYEGYIFNAAKNVWQWQALIPSVESLADTVITTPTLGEALVYDGTNWVNDTAGKIVDIKSVSLTATFSASLTSGSSIDVTGLSISHEISQAGNKVLLMAQIGNSGTDADSVAPSFAFAEGGSFLNIGDSEGSASRVGVGVNNGFIVGPGFIGFSHAPVFLHSPTSGSKTYTVRAINNNVNTRTVFVNRTGSPTVDVNRVRAASNLILMEVAG